MSIFKPNNPLVEVKDADGENTWVMKKEVFDSFNPSILGLGDISKKSEPVNVIAAIFDLQGFTNFCRQSDPQLSVPLFLNEYLDWIFTAIRKETGSEEFPEGYKIWHEFPILTKFMGDGLLVLWDANGMPDHARHNLIPSLANICIDYSEDFFKVIKRQVTEPPSVLRCGVAMGTVYSVGDGGDFVGPCINLAARLQKLDGFTFAFARRGFSPEKILSSEYISDFVLKETEIRGIGKELIYLWKTEFESASKQIQGNYIDP